MKACAYSFFLYFLQQNSLHLLQKLQFIDCLRFKILQNSNFYELLTICIASEKSWFFCQKTAQAPLKNLVKIEFCNNSWQFSILNSQFSIYFAIFADWMCVYMHAHSARCVRKEPIGTILSTKSNIPEVKIGGDWAIFVLNEGTKAQHTNAYVSISLSEERCKKSQSERFWVQRAKR